MPHSAFHPNIAPRVLETPKKLQQDEVNDLNDQPIDDGYDSETELGEVPEKSGDHMPGKGVSSGFVDLIDEALEEEGGGGVSRSSKAS